MSSARSRTRLATVIHPLTAVGGGSVLAEQIKDVVGRVTVVVRAYGNERGGGSQLDNERFIQPRVTAMVRHFQKRVSLVGRHFTQDVGAGICCQ